MKVSKEERDYLVMMLTVDRDMIGFIRGFAKPTKEDKERKRWLNKLIKKLKSIS
jgi:hypothetical protein